MLWQYHSRKEGFIVTLNLIIRSSMRFGIQYLPVVPELPIRLA